MSFIPSSLALLFISTTNSSTLPPTYSAIATHASFAEATAIDFNSVSTFWISPGSRKIWLPPILAAVSLICTSSSSLILPLSSASHIKSMVITFVTLAGGNFSWEFFSYKILPVDASINTADLDTISSFASSVSANIILTWVIAMNNASRKLINFFILSPLISI